MSKTITTLKGQMIFDIALQHCGELDKWREILKANTVITMNDTTGAVVDIGWPLMAGQQLIIEDEWVNNKVVRDITQPIISAE